MYQFKTGLDFILSRFRGDRYIWLIVFILFVMSLLTVYSAVEILAYKKQKSVLIFIFKHIILYAFSIGAMWFVHRLNYNYFRGLYKLLIPFTLLLLLYLTFFGSSINEASRWIKIPLISLTFQPSDLAKIAVILFLSRELSLYQFKEMPLWVYGRMLLVLGVISSLVFIENISTAVMMVLTSGMMMFVGKLRTKFFLGTMFVGAVLIAVLVVFTLHAPEQYLFGRLKTGKSRIEAFLSHDVKKVSKNETLHQVYQANYAIASGGGFFPQGPGNSRTKYFLPNAFSDYVYAIIIEEYGLYGGILVMILYLTLFYRSILIVINSKDSFGALMALGLGLSIAIQALFNMGVNVGLLPATGVTLPLISMGGSSIVFIGVAIGAIQSVSKANEEKASNTQDEVFDGVEEDFKITFDIKTPEL
ncbi:MAG: FtsW/RodA/SpoVE family cell cycle protein [Chitinophagales bacterium]|jgi:cell division protein FtsW|nr:FtsW/RodA/SpoVE family cell cycle protein [Chitinophagales bacterium]